MSTEVVETETEPETGPGLLLDGRHTLAAVGPEDLEVLWRPGAGGGLGWLLFRSGSTPPSPETQAQGRPPELWFEVGGSRIDCELRESAGWGEAAAAAVALFEAPAGVASSGTPEGAEPATCGIRVAGQEIVVELPSGWVERLRSEPPGLG